MRKSSRRPGVLRLAPIVLLLAPCLWAQSTNAGVTVIEFCDLQVPRTVEQANATFAMAFSMQVGENGEPIDIHVVEKHFLDESVFVNCIKRWRLPARAGETVRVEFQWVHGKGWTNLNVLGKTFAHHLRIAPGSCLPVGK